MKNPTRNIALGMILLVLTGCFFSVTANRSQYTGDIPDSAWQPESPQKRAGAKDSIQDEEEVETPFRPTRISEQTLDSTPPMFPVSPIIPNRVEDLNSTHPIDLRTPQNFSDDFQYNPLTNRYELHSKIGGTDIVTPISLTPEEYLEYTFQKSMGSYFHSRNREEFDTEEGNKDALSMFDFNFDLGPAEKLFGPGGVKLQAQGSALIKMGLTNNKTANPTLTERQRNKTNFDFDTQIQANIGASVGDKINFDLNYNTESTFDFDTKKLKLAYVGKEDEIIKVLEAGNVSMNTSNSLIRGGSALFGIKTELQFGKLTVGAVFSQQESQSRSTKSKGNVQTTPFEIAVDNYDENMHYFLGFHFYDNYDRSNTTLPIPSSGIQIDRIEVWVTNKRSNYDKSRNIVAFTDLGEYNEEHIGNSQVHPSGNASANFNGANNLYELLKSQYSAARDISTVNSTFEGSGFESGKDYEKIENARQLESNEYKLNRELGYISLRTKLQPDEVLAVAYSYTYRGNNYQVGEFSTDNSENTNQNIFLKLLKATNVSPSIKTWHLMMRNVYSVSTRNIEKDRFRLDVKYQSDTTGVYMNYINEPNIDSLSLIRVMNLDRLDSRNEPYPDGFFDYVEGYTVLSDQGKVIFPVVQPFGSHLRKKIKNDEIADKYVYQALYDTTLTVARQIAEQNKFIITGEYKGAGSSSIALDGFNISRGSVAVSANGIRLTENVDYIVDYNTGNVTITNPAYVNADISIQSENQSTLGMQRKTMMGLNLNYAFSPTFNVGATIMNLSEMPMTLKTNPGEESINNTLFGFNTNYSTQSYWLTHMLDKLPFLDLTAPSQISLTAEYAQLIPGHYKSEYGGDYSYIDDFEKAKMTIDLRTPYSWNLAATPLKFPESKLVDNAEYGYNRALLAWYTIESFFSRKSSLTPTHIKNDLDQLSNHYVREVYEEELFPEKQLGMQDASTIPVLNLAYYPKERGPYNLDYQGMNSDGTLKNPEARWGGIFKKIESGQTDFESQNIEHIEFWLLDPFIYDKSNSGDLYFNLGDVSEDVLKDEKKFFENGLPIDGDTTKIEKTVWGHVPKMQSLTYAFDSSSGARKRQDVGLNGLSTDEELSYPTYADYLTGLRQILSPETVARMQDDPFSPFNDPAGDNYHYYRGSDYDQVEMPILGRYKHYNGTEGNSAETEDTRENYPTAAKSTPDVEDINQDNTLNETERYFQYRIHLDPDSMQVGYNYIVDKRETMPLLKNGTRESVTWYQFKIPIKEYKREEQEKNVPADFSSVRFIRMFLTNFSDSTVLRFATLQLVRGDWRVYQQDLNNPNMSPPENEGTISISTVNLEENGDKQPVNYIMPPGVNRMVDPGQPQLRMQNEQSLSLSVYDLASGDARAVYKNTGIDTRQYRRLQMFVHAEKVTDDLTDLKDNEMSIFLRLGSDYKNNYYEYEIPLKLTPHGHYTTERNVVWPTENMFDFPFELLTNVKLNRNREKRKEGSDVTFATPYTEYDPNKPMNKVTVRGNPTLSEVKVIMVGVRNNSKAKKSAELWVNELRLTDFNEDGGWAANVNLYVGLSDLGSISFSGKKETAGFGGLDQGIMDRNVDDYQTLNFAAQIDAGKFFPEKAKVNIPIYFSYNEEVYDPKYNPLDQDILLKDALDAMDTQQERDSINAFAQDKVTNKSLEINNVRVNINSKTPMPYDPANFTLGYSFNERYLQNATTVYERETNTRLLFSYSYSSPLKPWQPFNRGGGKNSGGGNQGRNSQVKSSQGRGAQSGTNFFKDIGIGLLPKSLSINSDISRNYFELQLRELNSVDGKNRIPASFREDFFWNRDLSLQWDLTKNLMLDLRTGTEARIDAPHVQVNKKFNMDDYSLWKDSVNKSIRNWGSPMAYEQNFKATYMVPFKNIPILNFITAGLSYTASYDWQRGATIMTEEGASINPGNTISNQRTWGIDNVNINLMNLYSKSKFLDEANKKFSMASSSSRQGGGRGNQDKSREKANTEKLKKKYEGEVTLNLDSVTVVQHSLDNKRIRVTARGEDGKLYDIKYKKKDANSIEIKTKDSVKLQLVITQLPPRSDEWWYKPAQVTARGLMMVRSVGFTYTETSGMSIPGFMPEVGDFFGQKNTPLGMTPGLDFAFGFTDESYMDKAKDKGWLIDGMSDENNITFYPAMYRKNQMFNFTSMIEPITGMKINLTATRSSSMNSSNYYMYENPYKQFSGDFNMTTIALRTMFDSGNAKNGYHSKVFEQFRSNRSVIAQRLSQQYAGVPYPGGVGITGNFDPSLTPVNPNSIDVLIPAFLSAYTGQSPMKTPLDLFPSLLSILPNWTVSYEGFMQIPLFKKHFKSFVIDHGYKCRYSIGSYSSFTNWMEASDEMGFVENSISGTFIPSSPYNIMSVSIQEGFDPLFKITSTFLNNMTLNFNYRVIRNTNLNISSFQVVERNETAWSFGAGYRFENFNRVLNLPKTGGANFNNELRVSGELTFSKDQNLIRKIEDGTTQATQGNTQSMIKLTADYNMSKMITFQAYFDRQLSNPLVSSSAYPYTKTNFGISLRISFTR